MKKTFETFVLNMCLSTAQIHDLEILEVLLEHKVEPLCIEVIRICLQNLFLVPVKTRFYSWRFFRPVSVKPTIYVWGFILKMLNQRQERGGRESSKYDEDYIKTAFSTEIINELTLSENHEYHHLLMNLELFSNDRFIWFNKYPNIYTKYFKNIIANTVSFNDKNVLLAITNTWYSHIECDVLSYAISLAKKIRHNSSYSQWECLNKLIQISGNKYWNTVSNDEITVAQDNLYDVCSTIFDLIIIGNDLSLLNNALTNSSFILFTIRNNKRNT
jgi:hypothetical protein